MRILPVVLFAAVAAAVIAWALRANARFLPTGFVPRHAFGATSHHAGEDAFVPPAPVTGDPVVNYPGLAMLAVHLTALGIVLAAWCVRRYFRRPDRNVHSVPARLSFAALGSLAAALVTIPVAAISLGNAILFTGTLAAAMTVLQYTFVLVLVGTALFGVP
ncbi:hypothetical protein JOF56_004738 [Kibdelosporangium banguiense]|uniref:Uncharacterized protein n=1 Tax=Kibdelosporangium banguiense TaxID=1365924 RepID=A0ABS4TKC7_9PSEU|nr:hypothetical protein [Kibdelosporangium banguiense]MBP2324353.1 hypothetical protein [Kibdelosporangium banguiense]